MIYNLEFYTQLSDKHKGKMSTFSNMQDLEIFILHVPFISGIPTGNDFHQNEE